MFKKILFVLIAVALMVPAIQAEEVSDLSLGAPLLNVEDPNLVRNYPAALQMFPSRLWITVLGPAAYKIGGAYIASDMIGISAEYATMPGTASYAVNGGAWAGIYDIDYTEHMSILSYGMKLGDSMYAGIKLKNYFADGPYLNQTIDSNEKIVDSTEYTGLAIDLTPSFIMGLGDAMKLYANLHVVLNMMKYEQMINYETNLLTITPEMLQTLGAKLMLTYKMSEKTLLGASVDFSMQNNSYTVETTTNDAEEITASDTNGTMVGGVLGNPTALKLTLGAKVAADEKVNLFFTVPMGVSMQDGVHDNVLTDGYYDTTTVWTIPTLGFGAEAQVLSWLKFRLNAVPKWERTVVKPAGFEDAIMTGVDNKTITDAYGLTTGLGIGITKGKLAIDAVLQDAWFTDTLQTPLNRPSEVFSDDGGAAPMQMLGRVQVSYSF